MKLTHPRFVLALWLLLCGVAAAQSVQSRLMGTVLDDSGAALPGVTVTVQALGGRPIDVITDGSGRYLTPWLKPGVYSVSFTLSGFETQAVPNLALSGGQTIVLDQKLAVAPLNETVEVVAPAPVPPARFVPERPKAVPVDKEILASVCGPREAPSFSLAVGHIKSSADSSRELFGPGDLLIIDAGEEEGVTVGQNLVVRRRFQADRSESKKTALMGEQSAGLAQIVNVAPTTATAMLVYVCGEVFAGDAVERYAPQPAFFAVTDGTPNFADPATITIAEDGRTAGAEGQLMVINRGIMQGAQRGQRLTIFRRAASGPTITIGSGVVIAIRADSATVRIDGSTDAVLVGDLVALHR